MEVQELERQPEGTPLVSKMYYSGRMLIDLMISFDDALSQGNQEERTIHWIGYLVKIPKDVPISGFKTEVLFPSMSKALVFSIDGIGGTVTVDGVELQRVPNEMIAAIKAYKFPASQ